MDKSDTPFRKGRDKYKLIHIGNSKSKLFNILWVDFLITLNWLVSKSKLRSKNL